MLWKTRRTDTTKPLHLFALGALCLAPIAARADTSPASAPAITNLRKPLGLKTAVVASIDNGGDADVAIRGLKAANIALARSTGYAIISPTTVATNLKKAGIRYPFLPREYESVRKTLDKAQRVVAVTLTPAEMGDNNKTYKALVEMFDTSNGGLVGRGEATFTANPDSQDLVGSQPVAAPANSNPVLGTFDAPAGTPSATTTAATPAEEVKPTSPRLLAVDGAILRAIDEMNKPAQLSGIVVSRPIQHYARLSLGDMQGLRNGSRIEYLSRGQVVAYGTVVDVGKAESLATVAPEKAYPLVELNGDFRTVDIPVIGAAGRSREQIDAHEWRRFEQDFGVGLAVAAVGYLIFLNEDTPSGPSS